MYKLSIWIIDLKIEQLNCNPVLILLDNFMWGSMEIKSLLVYKGLTKGLKEHKKLTKSPMQCDILYCIFVLFTAIVVNFMQFNISLFQ